MYCQAATVSKIQPGVSQSPCFPAILFQFLLAGLLSQHPELSVCFHLLQATQHMGDLSTVQRNELEFWYLESVAWLKNEWNRRQQNITQRL